MCKLPSSSQANRHLSVTLPKLLSLSQSPQLCNEGGEQMDAFTAAWKKEYDAGKVMGFKVGQNEVQTLSLSFLDSIPGGDDTLSLRLTKVPSTGLSTKKHSKKVRLPGSLFLCVSQPPPG